jgi:hypothetical protein
LLDSSGLPQLHDRQVFAALEVAAVRTAMAKEIACSSEDMSIPASREGIRAHHNAPEF